MRCLELFKETYGEAAMILAAQFRPQGLKPGNLFGLEFALLVTSDEHLEHGLAVAVEKLHRARARPKNGRSTK